jgi:hypothetical protein
MLQSYMLSVTITIKSIFQNVAMLSIVMLGVVAPPLDDHVEVVLTQFFNFKLDRFIGKQ